MKHKHLLQGHEHEHALRPDAPSIDDAYDGGEGTYATIDLPPTPQRLAVVRLRVESPGRPPLVRDFIPGAQAVLGGASDADLVILDPTVSARHCAISHRGHCIEVTDLGSRNGLRVGGIDGIRVPQAACVPGDVISIGRSTLQVERPEAPSADDDQPLDGVIGRSAAMRRLALAVRRVARLRVPVLLLGESGVGKDVIARALHAESDRRARPFIALNAATIKNELAESELFGHVRGSFTGASRDRRGAFREANEGTLFLDEIAALPTDTQAKLLRVTEEGSVRPLGSEQCHPVDVRLIAATCDPLEVLVRERRFRADLYQRLAVCVLRVPPLRERTEDIPALSEHMLRRSEVGAVPISPRAMQVLREQMWLGNVRELRNVLVRAALSATSGYIDVQHVRLALASRDQGSSANRRRISPAEALRHFQEAGNNISAAARRANVPRTTMRDLVHAAIAAGLAPDLRLEDDSIAA